MDSLLSWILAVVAGFGGLVWMIAQIAEKEKITVDKYTNVCYNVNIK